MTSPADDPGTEEPRAALQLPGGFAPLGYRNYLLFWIGHLVSNTGRWVELTGAVWLVYDLTHSAVLLGLLGVARAVPSIVLSPISGVVADRFDQRRLLFLTQGIAMVLSAMVWVLVATGHIQFWYLYIQVALQAAINAFDASARQALFPRLVPRARISEAVTLSATAGRSSELLGPALGGVAIAVLSVASPFLINAVTFLALMGALILMRGVPSQAPIITSFRNELSDGLRYILAAPLLSGMLRMELSFGLFQINPVIITIIAREVLGVGPEGLGAMLSAPAFGSLIGIGVLLVFGSARRQGRFVIFCTLGYALALIPFGISGNYLISLAALAIIGIFDALITITRHSAVQLAVPGYMRGRVMANMRTLTGATTPLAQTQSGFLSDWLGGPTAVLTAAVAVVAAVVVTTRSAPILWTFTRDEMVEGAEADDRTATSPATRA